MQQKEQLTARSTGRHNQDTCRLPDRPQAEREFFREWRLYSQSIDIYRNYGSLQSFDHLVDRQNPRSNDLSVGSTDMLVSAVAEPI